MDNKTLTYMRKLKRHPSDYEMLDELYKYIKEISKNHYEDGNMSNEYLRTIRELKLVERSMTEMCILDTDIHESNKKFKKNKTYSKFPFLIPKDEDMLDYIVHYARFKLVGSLDYRIFINSIDFTNLCNESSRYVNLVCHDILKVPCSIYCINPGYDYDALLFGGGGYHYFNIVTINDKKYIVDCSYKQFFKKSNNSLERLGIPKIRGPYVGRFMEINEKRKALASTLLKQGWIEATDENLKLYLDGFTISFRNGLYYETLGDVIFETNYTAEDYYNFLNGYDNQIKYEDKKCLGLQHEPLKNPHFNFKK